MAAGALLKYNINLGMDSCDYFSEIKKHCTLKKTVPCG